MKNKTALIAVGGNALIKDKTHTSIYDQYQVVQHTIKPLLQLVQKGWNLIVTHGNGPQVGFVLRRSDLALPHIPPIPIDYAGADIQGAVGYMFNKAFRNALHASKLHKEVVTVVTEVIVDRNDSRFQNPTKPIGSHMSEDEAKEKAKEYGWQVKEDAGRGWRRVVASPLPQQIVEFPIIKLLSEQGYIVIACGGGGIPVIRDEHGNLSGVEAVIDKDYASALLASDLQVDLFVIATEVEKVATGFGTPDEKWLNELDVNTAQNYLDQGEFHEGSMGPKVRAMISYIKNTHKQGIITSLENLPNALEHHDGTWFY